MVKEGKLDYLIHEMLFICEITETVHSDSIRVKVFI